MQTDSCSEVSCAAIAVSDGPPRFTLSAKLWSLEDHLPCPLDV
jgi:hypothetical protein